MNLTHAVNSGKLDETILDARVRSVLEQIKKSQRAGIPENWTETTRNTEEDRALLRRTAAESIVLLKNEDSMLPFKRSGTVRTNSEILYRCLNTDQSDRRCRI